MPIDAIVRVSFQSNSNAIQATRIALVGDATNTTGPGPFKREGTAAFLCSEANEAKVAKAMSDFTQVLAQYALSIDFISITILRRK
jgi:hypothetical protein